MFFYGSENVRLFGHETALDQVIDEMIYSLGYVPRYIRKEIVNDRERLMRKLDMAIKSTIMTA